MEHLFEEFCRTDMDIFQFKTYCNDRILPRIDWENMHFRRLARFKREYAKHCRNDQFYPVWKLRIILK